MENKEIKNLLNALQLSNNKYNDYKKISVQATSMGNWEVFYDNKNTGLIYRGNLLSDDTIREYNLEHSIFEMNYIKENMYTIHQLSNAIDLARQYPLDSTSFDKDEIIQQITNKNSNDLNKTPVYAITSKEGHNEYFYDEIKAQEKIDTLYKKDFPNVEFWTEEIKIK